MAKRRVKGEESVYRRGDGRVVGAYVDANGKRRYVSGKTKAEVRRRLRGLLAYRDEGIAYDSESLTLETYLARWGSRRRAVRSLLRGIQKPLRGPTPPALLAPNPPHGTTPAASNSPQTKPADADSDSDSCGGR